METIPYLDLPAQYRTLRSEVLTALKAAGCEPVHEQQHPLVNHVGVQLAAGGVSVTVAGEGWQARCTISLAILVKYSEHRF